jgi:hypothetical protein
MTDFLPSGIAAAFDAGYAPPAAPGLPATLNGIPVGVVTTDDPSSFEGGATNAPILGAGVGETVFAPEGPPKSDGVFNDGVRVVNEDNFNLSSIFDAGGFSGLGSADTVSAPYSSPSIDAVLPTPNTVPLPPAATPDTGPLGDFFSQVGEGFNTVVDAVGEISGPLKDLYNTFNQTPDVKNNGEPSPEAQQSSTPTATAGPGTPATRQTGYQALIILAAVGLGIYLIVNRKG